MRPRFGVVSLGVADGARARAFYEALGFRGSAEPGGPAVFLVGNAVLALVGAGEGPERARVTYAARGWDEVSALAARAEAAGARVLAAPARLTWGGAQAAFADPDGHVWSVVWDPELPPEARVTLAVEG